MNKKYKITENRSDLLANKKQKKEKKETQFGLKKLKQNRLEHFYTIKH